MKIPIVGAELMNADLRADGQTDMTKLIVAFRNFANAPNKITVGYIFLVGELPQTADIKGRVTFSHFHVVIMSRFHIVIL
jgi:hypothetical protein